MTRTSNKKAIESIKALEPFKASNMFGEWFNCGVGKNYVVYSYGYHFPMYVWDSVACMWIGNKDKCSLSTSRQQSQTRPDHVDKWVDTNELISIAYYGIVDKIINKVSLQGVDS